jgi:acyl-CoA thioesterase FadM
VVLLLRFLIAIVASLFRSRIGATDESTVRFTVLPNDCDLNFHLNAGRFLSFMDVARMDLLGRTGLLRRMLRQKWRPLMGGVTVRYRRSILPFERFDIRSRVLGWDEKWFYIEHVVEREGNLCAIGTVRTLVRSNAGNVATRDVLALLGEQNTPSPELPEFVRRWRDAENAR